MKTRTLLPGFALLAVITCGTACGSTDAEILEEVATPPASHAEPSPATPPAVTSPPASPPAPPPEPPAPPPEPPGPPKTAAECFASLVGPMPGPDYDQFGPKVLPSCAGTHHQTIEGIEKVVFLGDSITVGTPPTPIGDFYANRLAAKLRLKYGAGLEVKSCADWGARTDDLLLGKKQVERCWPNGTESKKTLVVMTNGGNDIAAWAKSKLSTADAMVKAEETAQMLRDAIEWLQEPGRFSAGVYVAFANVYEYTDTSGDLSSCPTASLAGFSGQWPEGHPAVVHLHEQYMKIAVETGTDLVFLGETFCGHGFKRDDASLQCYRGPNTEAYFDLTCIHPTPKGHGVIADLFEKVISGT